MSYTTIYSVPESGEILKAAGYKNAFGSGPFIWSNLCVKYLGWEKHGWLLSDPAKLQKLWDLAADSRLDWFERVTHATTFDKVMVRRENLYRVARALEEFVAKYPPGDHVCSLLEQAETLRTLALDKSCYAVCWCQTSVSDDVWHAYERGDEEETPLWDISKDKGHWFLFDELKCDDETFPCEADLVPLEVS